MFKMTDELSLQTRICLTSIINLKFCRNLWDIHEQSWGCRCMTA